MKTDKLIDSNELLVSIGSRKKVLAQDIILMQAELNYTLLFLIDGKRIFVSYNLGKLEERLNIHQTFIRPNRNTIVNLNFVTNYNNDSININNTIVPISRRRKETISLNFKNFKKSKPNLINVNS